VSSKVAAIVRVSVRRVYVQMASSFPMQDLYHDIVRSHIAEAEPSDRRDTGVPHAATPISRAPLSLLNNTFNNSRD